ncbi:hypothetical protein [Kribbella sp. NPDC006257]|uniref:hypothetical protein n=1 Tax=Kribbella sp. NPDC006257 TaxID=3156738 RepID=UPI0033BFA8D2
MNSDKEDDRQHEQRHLGELLAELAEVHDPATEEELAAARAEWPDHSPRAGTPAYRPT